MYRASDLRKGLKIELDGTPYEITDFSFMKPGKGQSLYNCKLKNLLTGSTLAKTFRSSDKIDKPQLEEQRVTYSYQDGDNFIFMDENYEQLTISSEALGDARFLLAENVEVNILFHNNKPVEVKLPNFVELEVVETEPGARGNTATNVLKPAKLENGHKINAGLFINTRDVVKIDTRTGEYVDRVRRSSG